MAGSVAAPSDGPAQLQSGASMESHRYPRFLAHHTVASFILCLIITTQLAEGLNAAEAPATANDHRSGTISGRISNGGTGVYLDGARIVVNGIPREFVSENGGRYS